LPEAEKYSLVLKIGEIDFIAEKPIFSEANYNRWSFRV